MIKTNCKFYVHNRSTDGTYHNIDQTTAYDFDDLGLLDIVNKHTKKWTEKHIFLSKVERDTYQVECLEFYDGSSYDDYLMRYFIINQGMDVATALFGTPGRRLTIINLDPTDDQKKALEEYFKPPIPLWKILSDSDSDEEYELFPDLKDKTWSYTIDRQKIKSCVTTYSMEIPVVQSTGK